MLAYLSLDNIDDFLYLLLVTEDDIVFLILSGLERAQNRYHER